MATKKKKKKIPSVPEAQMIDVGNLKEAEMTYKPMTTEEMVSAYKQFMAAQQEYFPQMLENQITAQRALFNQMASLQRENAPYFAWEAKQLYNRYAPEFQATYGALGQRINEGIAQGYELGPELAGEVEQGIRAAQTARGNYLGPALSAEEAFGRGQAALNLYNQRIGAAQNYLQGRNPTDIMGSMAQTYMGQNYYPQSTYLEPGMGVQAAGIQQQGQSAYNQTLNAALQDYNRNYISAFGANNEAQYNNYDRNFEQYLYGQAVQHGLYSMPQMGGGGMGAGGQIAGSAIGAVGAIGGGILAAF